MQREDKNNVTFKDPSSTDTNSHKNPACRFNPDRQSAVIYTELSVFFILAL